MRVRIQTVTSTKNSTVNAVGNLKRRFSAASMRFSSSLSFIRFAQRGTPQQDAIVPAIAFVPQARGQAGHSSYVPADRIARRPLVRLLARPG